MAKLNGKGKAGLVGTAAIALTLALPPLMVDEGKSNVTYLDIANVPTYCYGHADRAGKVGVYHTDAECEALLRADAQKKLKAVLRCTPGLARHPYQLAAATRLTFNIGEGNYCGSTAAKRFNAGRLSAACDAFLPWHGVTTNKPIKGAVSVRRLPSGRYYNVIRGLVARRKRERAMCLTELPA